MNQTVYTSATSNIPPHIQQQAMAYQLGNFIRVSRPKYTNPVVIVAIMVGAIVLDIIALVALLNWLDRISVYFLIIPVAVIIWGVRALTSHNLNIYLFDYGYIDSRGKQIRAIRWEQIATIWTKISTTRYGTHVSFTINLFGDAQSLQYGNTLPDVANIEQMIQNAVTHIQLPRAIATFEAGTPVVFGKVSVTAQGITDGARIIPWDQIDTIQIAQGIIAARRGASLLKLKGVKTQDVPNIGVLTALVNHIAPRMHGYYA